MRSLARTAVAAMRTAVMPLAASVETPRVDALSVVRAKFSRFQDGRGTVGAMSRFRERVALMVPSLLLVVAAVGASSTRIN